MRATYVSSLRRFDFRAVLAQWHGGFLSLSTLPVDNHDQHVGSVVEFGSVALIQRIVQCFDRVACGCFYALGEVIERAPARSTCIVIEDAATSNRVCANSMANRTLQGEVAHLPDLFNQSQNEYHNFCQYYVSVSPNLAAQHAWVVRLKRSK